MADVRADAVGVDNLREAELAKPVELIARGRGFEVKGEFPLPVAPGKSGAPPCIDFVLVHRSHRVVVALEMKFKRKDRAMAGSLASDAVRLHHLTLDDLNRQIKHGKAGAIKRSVDGFSLVRGLLVVSEQAAIVGQIMSEPRSIKSQFRKLVKALLPEGVQPTAENFSKAMLGVIATKPVALRAGSLRPGSTASYKRFWVASLIHQQTWDDLPAGNPRLRDAEGA